VVIELAGVRKTYSGVRSGHTIAVDGLTLAVPRGGVHGFLGPNGSGKTTTIRILLGLVAADAGEVRVLGAEVPHELARVAGSVGALVESPQLFPAFSGRRNLQILATLADLPTTRVDELLEFVGLRERADDRVKGYSLGMRQRLAIAAAMLKSPELLILDEPTNGLDPAGMVEVRELIRALGSDGRTTVFLSSHLLAEVAAVCDAVTILRRGQLVATGDVAEVLAMAGGEGQLRVGLRDADEVARAAGVLAEGGFGATPAPPNGLVVAADDGARVNALLGAAGIWASELTAVRPDLERAFLDLTAEGEATA
jgi:ABC-2 type transport system ATP-binding protein